MACKSGATCPFSPRNRLGTWTHARIKKVLHAQIIPYLCSTLCLHIVLRDNERGLVWHASHIVRGQDLGTKGLEGLAEACGSTMKSRSAWTLHKTELASVREQCRWLLWQRFRLGVPCHSVEHDGCTLSLRFLLSAQPSPAVSYRHRLQVQSPSFNTRRQRSMISSQSSTTFRWLLSQDKQPPPRPQGVYAHRNGHHIFKNI